MGEARLTAGTTAEEMCKQDQQVPATAGGLWQERLDARYFNIKAINKLLHA